MADDDDQPFTIPGDASPAPEVPSPTDAPKRTRKPRSSAPKAPTPAIRAKAQAAAEGVSDVVTQVGVIVSPFTPLGGAYLMASSAAAEETAAQLAEVEPRVLKALTKAKKITAWAGLTSLAAGFVAAIMVEKEMVGDMISEIPFGPADIQLGPMYLELVRQGRYASRQDQPFVVMEDPGGSEDGSEPYGGPSAPPAVAHRVPTPVG